jgi:hypothetical protein
VARAGEGFDHVETIRAAVGLSAAPRAAGVFGLDPDVIRVQLGADGEVHGPAAGVQDGVGRELGCDEDASSTAAHPARWLATALRTWCNWSARPG